MGKIFDAQYRTSNSCIFGMDHCKMCLVLIKIEWKISLPINTVCDRMLWANTYLVLFHNCQEDSNSIKFAVLHQLDLHVAQTYKRLRPAPDAIYTHLNSFVEVFFPWSKGKVFWRNVLNTHCPVSYYRFLLVLLCLVM